MEHLVQWLFQNRDQYLFYSLGIFRQWLTFFFFFGVLSDLYMLDVSPCSLCIDTKCFIVLYCICSCVSIAIMRSLSPVTCNLSKKLELFCFNW